jgi:3-hydroxyacyl-[acyl-carrier-protein] dehydratase
MNEILLDRAAIEAILPHRAPMLLIDEVTELEPGARVVARKTVTDEDCAGHFPGNPIMPGVKMVEALAQCGAVAVLSQEENRGKLALFAGIDDVRFKRVVRPGEVLLLECEVETVRGPVGRGKVKATVDGKLAVRGTLTFAVTDADCAGHFPGNPIMPGVKMVEALAQCGAVAVLSQEENRGKLALFAGIDDVRFKRVVRPGDVLLLECEVETVRGPVGRGKVKATVDGKLAVRGTLTFAVGDEE